jgi:hypothetical protein
MSTAPSCARDRPKGRPLVHDSRPETGSPTQAGPTGGRKLLRLEVRNSRTPVERKPPWIRARAHIGPEYTRLRELVQEEGLHTVCEQAGCPNIFECWEDREATFLIGGDRCTRRCDFCQIDTGRHRAASSRRPGCHGRGEHRDSLDGLPGAVL